MSFDAGDRRMPSGQRRAAIFFYDGYISISASTISAAVELSKRGYQVDLFYNKPPMDVPPPDLPPLVTLHEHVPATRWLTNPIFDSLRRRQLRKLSQKVADNAVRQKSARLRSLVKAVVAAIEIPQFALFCRRQLKAVDLAIAIDMNSLAAMDFSLPRTVPFIYWSLEIIMLSEAKDPVLGWMKRHELKRLHQARAVAIQSPLRRALLEQDGPIPPINYVEVPNAPSAPLQQDLPRDFYRRRFPIPPQARIVLHSGFISTSLLSQEIARDSQSWPEDFVLVFHERQQRDPEEPYIKAVQQAGGARTFLSLDPVPFNEVDIVYAGADIGIVCYQVADRNEQTGWSSSGKLVYYLRHGLPIVVVTPECPSIIAEWGCGVWVPEVDGIGEALARINSSYEEFSRHARAAYDALFDFSAAFDRLLASI